MQSTGMTTVCKLTTITYDCDAKPYVTDNVNGVHKHPFLLFDIAESQAKGKSPQFPGYR
jgi:hypothetical protein